MADTAQLNVRVGVLNLTEEQFRKAVHELYHPRPTRLQRLWRWLKKPRSLWPRRRKIEPPIQYLTLLMVGGRGEESLQIKVPRTGALWTVEKGVARNSVALPLPYANKSSHWLLQHAHGSLLAEGRLRRALPQAVVPAGAIVVGDWA